jgi:hypothetical protein
MELPPTVYLRKRWAEQAFWDYAKVAKESVPLALQFLVTQDRVFVGVESARRILDYFHSLGFRDGERGHIRTPVEVVDYDGNAVSLAELAPAA